MYDLTKDICKKFNIKFNGVYITYNALASTGLAFNIFMELVEKNFLTMEDLPKKDGDNWLVNEKKFKRFGLAVHNLIVEKFNITRNYNPTEIWAINEKWNTVKTFGNFKEADKWWTEIMEDESGKYDDVIQILYKEPNKDRIQLFASRNVSSIMSQKAAAP